MDWRFVARVVLLIGALIGGGFMIWSGVDMMRKQLVFELLCDLKPCQVVAIRGPYLGLYVILVGSLLMCVVAFASVWVGQPLVAARGGGRSGRPTKTQPRRSGRRGR